MNNSDKAGQTAMALVCGREGEKGATEDKVAHIGRQGKWGWGRTFSTSLGSKRKNSLQGEADGPPTDVLCWQVHIQGVVVKSSSRKPAAGPAEGK